MNNLLTASPTILVIDDDPAARLALEGLLEDTGTCLSFAVDGKTGLKQAAELQPDAIILDIMMPEIDGYEVCRELRADPNLAETHIIMLTALDDREARLTGLMAGADDFISKPYDGLELHLRLKSAIRSNRYRRLLAERARFAWIVEHSDTGYLILGQIGEIHYANSSAHTLLQLPEIVEGIDFPQHILRFFQPHPQEVWENWLEEPSQCYLIRPETPYSRACWLLLEALDAPLDKSNRRVVRVSDVTERVTLEQDMRRFHTIVAHKLRTPVALLYNSMAFLETRLKTIPPEDVKTFVNTAWVGSKRLADTVRDIINYIDAPMMAQPVNRTELKKLEELAIAIQQRYEIRPLTIHLPEELRCRSIAMNISALEIVLSETIENAKKFHPRGDPTIEIAITPQGPDHVRISIQDDGLSLTAQQLKWALQPYFQGEKYFTGEVAGIGLGLPTAAMLTWQAGGELYIGNREEQSGIRVDISLPILPD